MEFILTSTQYAELAGLAYHQADLHYRIERGTQHDGETNTAELQESRRNVTQHFPALDALGVPFWIQNIALVWAENWRNYASGYLWQELEKKGVKRL